MTPSVSSGHQPIQRVVDPAQTCLQQVALALSFFFDQRLAEILALAVQAVPYIAVFSTNGDFN